MRPSARAILAAAVPAGVLLFVAWIGLEWWENQYFWETSGLDPDLTLYDPPPATGVDAVVERILEFVWLCFFSAMWAAIVVVPAILVARHFLSGRWSSRLVAFGVVAATSALAFAFQWSPAGPWPEGLTLGIGGTIGLVCASIADALLPPNTSLERTRGR